MAELLNKSVVDAMVASLKAEEKIISDSRDRLRELLDDIEGQVDSLDTALYDLQAAIDTLSQLV